MKKKMFWWVLTVLWCTFIFYQSSKIAVSSNFESGFIVNLLNLTADFLFGNGHVVFTQHFVRKTAHLTEYIILGFLLYNALYAAGKRWGSFAKSSLAGAIYTVTDEIHQYFVPGRAMMLTDVAIDTTGVIIGGLTALALLCCIRKASPA